MQSIVSSSILGCWLILLGRTSTGRNHNKVRISMLFPLFFLSKMKTIGGDYFKQFILDIP